MRKPKVKSKTPASSAIPTPESKPKSPGNYIDAFVKKMFGQVMVFSEFLTNYADPKFVAEIDLKRIRPAPTHYIGYHGDERIVDLVWQCPLKNGLGNMMAVIIFEHQNKSLKKIPLKLHKYISSIWDAETKDGKKVLSAPYFIVLRTGKKPHRGPLPKIRDSLPKGRDGKPIGKIVEIEYDVVDLPAWDFDKLVGSPVLRLALGILKSMAESNGETFPEALSPLFEIADGEQKKELTADFLDFATKMFAAQNKRFDEEMMSRALKPIFKEQERFMIATIFEERETKAEARGEARGKVLNILETRFKKVPKRIENMIRQMNDIIALKSCAEHAATCLSLEEFEKALR